MKNSSRTRLFHAQLPRFLSRHVVFAKVDVYDAEFRPRVRNLRSLRAEIAIIPENLQADMAAPGFSFAWRPTTRERICGRLNMLVAFGTASQKMFLVDSFRGF